MKLPSIKAKVKTVIEQFLYRKSANAYNELLTHIIVKDALVRKDGLRCFTHRGKNYIVPGERPNCRVYPRLTKENREAMDEILAQWMPVFQDEQPKVAAYLSHVLNTSDDPSVYLRGFPAPIRSCLKGLYDVYGISIDECEFAEGEPENPVWKEAYRLLCIRLTSNLLLE